MTWVRILLVLSKLLICTWLQSQLIYKVVSPGRDTITYLVGTYNVLPQDQFQYTSLLDSILEKADLVFTESFYEEKGLRPLVHAKDRIRMMSYPNKKRLGDFISQEEYRQVYAYYQSNFGINKRVFKQLSYFIPIVMDQQIRYGSDQYIKPDRHIVQQPEKKKKTIYNLDPPTMTKAAFEALAKRYPPEWLVQLAATDLAYREEMKERRECYRKQDTSCLKKRLREKIRANPAAYDQLIKRRTRYWMAEMDRTGRSRNLLIAGIDMLLEEQDGLLELLRKKGYTIQLISSHL